MLLYDLIIFKGRFVDIKTGKEKSKDHFTKLKTRDLQKSKVKKDKRPDGFEIFILSLLIFICCLFFVVTDWENLIHIPFLHYNPFEGFQ